MSNCFKNIVGHQRQLKSLTEDLEKDNLAHAYLLSGPSDLGKFTVAKNFAKAIQTRDLDEDKAFQVSALIDRGIHSDTIFFQPAADEQTIKIEDVRKLMQNLQMTGDSWKRVLVMQDIDRMTMEASNAMLKMLEEPPPKVLYIFTTSNSRSILETILSRVRTIDFHLMPEEEMVHALKLRYRLEDESKIKRVAVLSLGRIAKAIKLMEGSEHLEAYEQICSDIQAFLKTRDIAAGFSFISQIHSDMLLIQIFLETASIVLRNDLRAATDAGDREAMALATTRLRKLFEVKALSETNSNSRLLLENFILSL